MHHNNKAQVETASEPVAATVLPDGSAFFTASFPLPREHWLYAPQCAEWDSERDTSADTPQPILCHAQRDAVIAAMRYAIRGATMNGKEPDFDPDALVLNAAYALCGPRTSTTPQPPTASSDALCVTAANLNTAYELYGRITSYLIGGGLFNPELAIQGAVSDLLIDCRTYLDAITPKPQKVVKNERV